jgi:hypothetical protein
MKQPIRWDHWRNVTRWMPNAKKTSLVLVPLLLGGGVYAFAAGTNGGNVTFTVHSMQSTQGSVASNPGQETAPTSTAQPDANATITTPANVQNPFIDQQTARNGNADNTTASFTQGQDDNDSSKFTKQEQPGNSNHHPKPKKEGHKKGSLSHGKEQESTAHTDEHQEQGNEDS